MAVVLFFRVRAQPAGDKKMGMIAEDIAVGSMAFLKVEFTILAVYAVVVFGAIAAFLDLLTAVAFKLVLQDSLPTVSYLTLLDR